MSEARPPARFERIVVACDPTPPGSAALAAAAALAASLQAELAGLFVEDVNLLRMAALPFTRELGLASALLRPIETTDIEREFRRHAEQTRKALEAAALASSLRWSFQVIRGQPLTAALSAVSDADLLVVKATAHPAARSVRERPRTAREAAVARARHGLRVRPVAVLFDGSPQAERALALAAALAERVGCPLTLWVAADNEADFGNMRSRARDLLAASDGAATILGLRGRDLPTVAEAVAAASPAALVWHDVLDSEQLAVLLSVVRCPLVLAR